MFTAPFVYALAALLACILGFAVYTLAQAAVGWIAGIHVQEVSIGFGPSLWEKTMDGCKFRVGCIPMGGSTHFAGMTQDDEVPVSEAGVPLGKRFIDTPPWTRLILVLVGPVSNLLIGIVLIGVAVWAGAPQLAVTTPAESMVRPCAVGGLTLHSAPSSWAAQYRLLQETALEFIWRTVSFQSLEGWGGYVGFIVTAGAIGTLSGWGWLTSIGILFICMGVSNLLPLPALNGFQALSLLYEMVTGLSLSRLPIWLHLPAILLTFVIMIRVFWIDLRWCWGVLFP